MDLRLYIFSFYGPRCMQVLVHFCLFLYALLSIFDGTFPSPSELFSIQVSVMLTSLPLGVPSQCHCAFPNYYTSLYVLNNSLLWSDTSLYFWIVFLRLHSYFTTLRWYISIMYIITLGYYKVLLSLKILIKAQSCFP